MFLVRISITEKRRADGFFFLVLIISYCMLSLHIITFQGYVLRSNINKTKYQILLKQTTKPLRSGGQIGDICAAHQKSLTGRESRSI